MTYCYTCDTFVARPIVVEHRPYCQRCACKFPDDDYRPVPHDDDVTARIDAVIREADNQPVAGGYSATIPLAEQIAQYGIMAEEVLDVLHDNLEDAWFREWVIATGVERLIAGFDEFGDTMYGWDANRRDDEMVEELADYVAYGTSGPFFRVTP